MRWKSKSIGLIAAATLLLTVAGCTAPDNVAPEDKLAAVEFAEGSTMAEISERGTVRIGVKFDQPPFSVKNLNGNLEGFDVAIADSIAKALNVAPENIEWVETVSANREPFIQQGKVDYVVAVYAMTEARREAVSFAGPYFLDPQDIMVQAGNPGDITSLDDLAGKKVCAATGTPLAANLLAESPDAEIVGFDTQTKCAEALKAGQVDAYTANTAVLLGYAAKEPGSFQILGINLVVYPYGIGFEKGDVEFCEFVSAHLEEAAADGEYADIWTSTLGGVYEAMGQDTTPPAMPQLEPCS